MQHTTQKKRHTLRAFDIKNIMERRLGATHNKKKMLHIWNFGHKKQRRKGQVQHVVKKKTCYTLEGLDKKHKGRGDMCHDLSLGLMTKARACEGVE